MDVLSFAITVILVTASGALAPGPLFFANIAHGTRSGVKSGLVFSVAHTLVEFALVMLLALGLLTVASKPIVKLVIGVIGGAVLIAFGISQIHNSFRYKPAELKRGTPSSRHLFLIGLAFTGLNPYFVIWWLTAGAQLIIISLEFAALAGVLFMYLCHVWMDYVWLTAVAHSARKGTNIMGLRWYRFLMVIFGGILTYFGLTFLIDGLAP
ncbi:MAG: LysE family transporter [Candidatus Thermoplasmatota archaeon]|nr:LysE family transporter [Candidatus Thermoplasmatota archaeon]